MSTSTILKNIGNGSVSNTLGTLGRSVFNSSVGTVASSNTMDQVYKTIEKLNSSIETVDKVIDYEAYNGRNKADDLYSLLAGMDIKSSSDFMNKNREFMKRLMRLNKQEKDITLDALGVDVTGQSNTVKNEYVRHYDHVGDNDYYEDYVSTIRQNQIVGDETTSYQLESSTHYNYSGLHNDLYSATENLYPDDDNYGTFTNKWIVENRNSLLYKTKKLFNSKKINTIISRFHTNPNQIPSSLDNAKSKYGLSHGRNLLKKAAEQGYSSYYVNGYDNPYCRVWTHHHQYDRYYKTIRPFSHVDEQGNYEDTISVQDFHNWSQFADSKDKNKYTQGKWGWKKNNNNGWENSVLQNNGKVNITPKYVNGGDTNIHTKQCMFSIENLAWRGYDPYSFEQALSWEQRGPLGGRIMWFPPYGITFNETTSTTWQNTSFLGRGEDVYTYANTTRTGTLNFMMVVDHPSILDYVSWNKQNKDVTDTDVLRFLAGCGEGDGNGLRDKASPTPLTDEYTQIHEEQTGNIVEPTSPPEEERTEVSPNNEPKTPKQLCFYVFYPNNYSGTYDDPYEGDGYKINQESKVEAIPYLIAGKGAQKSSGAYNSGSFVNDIVLNEQIQGDIGNGYQMGNGGLGDSNYITGTSAYDNNKTSYWTGLKETSRNASYKGDTNRKWYYRIDGRYVYPKNQAEEKLHYYNQRFTASNASSYVNKKDYKFNFLISKVQSIFSNQIEKDGNSYVYSANRETNVFTLAEMAYVLYGKDKHKSESLKDKCNGVKAERAKLIEQILEQEVQSIEAIGGASMQGYVELNKILAENRAKTAAHWFAHMMDLNNNVIKSVTHEIADNKSNINVGGVDSEKSIANRYARVIVTFKTTDKTTATTANNTDVNENESVESGNNTTVSSNIYNYEVGNTYSEDIKIIREALRMKLTETDKDMFYDYSLQEEIRNFQKEKGIDITGNIDEETLKALGIWTEHGLKSNQVNNKGGKTDLSFSRTGATGVYVDENGVSHYCDIYEDNGNPKKKWYKISEGTEGVGNFVSVSYASEEDNTPIARYGGGNTDENRLRYDQEYHFFKVLQQTDPVVYGSLMDKLQYFDPAFHSMTPEGFNGRLTFLQQCMRQGNTVSSSDGMYAKTANNLAFGRAPYCVLRLGDFYNQMIIIDSLSISYDPLVWDLNVEGAGVQPLIANIQLSFKFIGGGDMTGPVRRLQNAMSFNYYANARLYDNRADRIERKWSDKTNGAIEHDEILVDDLTKSVNGETGNLTNYGKTYTKNIDNNDGGISQYYSTQMYQ